MWCSSFSKWLVILNDAFLGELVKFWVTLSENFGPSEAPLQVPQMQVAKIVAQSNSRFILQICFLDILKPRLWGRWYLPIHMTGSKFDVVSWRSFIEFKVISAEFPVCQCMMLHVFEELRYGDSLNPACLTSPGSYWPSHHPICSHSRDPPSKGIVDLSWL